MENKLTRIKGTLKLVANNSHINKSKDVINVGFLAQYIPAWNKFEGVYREMLNNSRFNPFIICIPENINSETIEKRKNDTYEYFISQGYDVINALQEDGSWYDLKQLSLRYVFYTRPYNYYLPEEYTTGNVSKYAHTCLIMYGMSITTSECKTTLNIDFTKDLKYYFAESECIKEKLISEYPISTRLGIRKVLNCGSTGLEQVILDKDKQTDEWDFYDGKFRAIWTPRWTTDPQSLGGSSFFLYYKDIVEYAKKHSDVSLLLRPHPLMFDNFIKTKEMTQEEVESYKELIQETLNTKLNESKEYDAILWNSDVLISDLSGIMPEYFITGKPIIFCSKNIDIPLFSNIEKMMEGCYIAYSKEEMFGFLEQLRTGNDPLKEKRQTLIEELFGNDIGNTSKRIVENIIKDADFKD